MTFHSDVITIEKDGPVATLWMNRPDKLNALSGDMWDGLAGAVSALAADEDVRAIILAGRGKSFCVGLDLIESGIGGNGTEKPASQGLANLRQFEATGRLQQIITDLSRLPQPVIAAVHGHCLGAGLDLITACDIRLAAATATFSVRETRIALVADVGTLQRLPKVVNAGHVAELAYTGKDIDAARAEKIGLVNDVYEDFDALYNAALTLAADIATNSPMTVRGTKFILQQSETMTTEQSLLLNAIFTTTTSLQSNDLREAMQAFMERRPAKFTGA